VTEIKQQKPIVSLLFVCMGNICRSPTAQGVAEKLLAGRGWQDLVSVDSAGTHAYHIGHPPDGRAIRAAAGRDIDLTAQLARRVQSEDFELFDYILAMDEHNLENLQQMVTTSTRGQVLKMLQFSSLGVTENVPDPYYGGIHGFRQVLDLLLDAMEGFLDHLGECHPELTALQK
jgi:protein-tyrosine phosphatase